MKAQTVSQTQTPDDVPSSVEVQNWIVTYVADLLEVDADDIDPTVPFDRYGLDSASAVGMTGDIENWLGRKSIRLCFMTIQRWPPSPITWLKSFSRRVLINKVFSAIA